MRPILKKTLIILSIVLIGLFFRICEKTPSSLWTDEFATYWISSAPSLSECISRATPTQGQSPFYFVLEWIVLKIFPHSESSLRLISLLASLVSIYLLYEISLLLFNNNGDQAEKEKPSSNHQIFSLPAIFASLLFAMDTNQIYYAQEARPYTLAIMFALASQLFFLKLLRQHTLKIFSLYVVFSALICYTHYIFGTMILFQNIWILLVLLKARKAEFNNPEAEPEPHQMTLKLWCKLQISVIILLIPLMFHLLPILSKSSKWTWLKSGGFFDTFEVFGSLFNFRIILMFAGVFILLFLFERSKWAKHKITEKAKNSNISFLILWLLTPPLFAYFASIILRTSLLDTRYMLLSLIPFYLLTACFLNLLKNQHIKLFLLSFILFAYFGGVLVPIFKKESRFSYRLEHNWRDAIGVLNKNLRPGDVIVLRSGFIKENWLPDTRNPVIMEYVKAPLNSFYFSPDILKKSPHTIINIYNMTFSREREFYTYYDSIFDECETHQRVWMIGVNPPNTNYTMSQVPEIMRNSHGKTFEKDFSGVYLVLLRKRPAVYKIFK